MDILSFFKNNNTNYKTDSVNGALPELKGKVLETPLTDLQKTYWYKDKLSGASNLNIPIILNFGNMVRPSEVENAVLAVLERHAILRTVFREKNGIPYQELLEKDHWKLSFADYENLGKTELGHLISEEISRPFNLATDYPFRAQLVKFPKGVNVLIGVAHHLVADEVSNQIIRAEIKEYHQVISMKKGKFLPELKHQFSDYNEVFEEQLAKNLNFNLAKLEGMTAIDLPTDFKRPKVQGTSGRYFRFSLGKLLSSKLHQLAKDEDTSLYVLLTAALKTLFYRYSGQEDITLGGGMTQRVAKDFDSTVGVFDEILILRSNLANNPNFQAVLSNLNKEFLEAREKQIVLIPNLVQSLSKQPDFSRHPLFPISFTLNEVENKEALMEQYILSEYNLLEDEYQNYPCCGNDMTIKAVAAKEDIAFSIAYSTALFESSTIRKMARHFEAILVSISEDVNLPIGQLKMLSKEDINRLLFQYNNTERLLPREKTILDIFTEQAIRNPLKTAIFYKNRELSYRDLDKKSNYLANYIKEKYNIKSDDLIGISMDCSKWSVITILGILKAGAGYVPIGTNLSKEEQALIVKDSGIQLLLINSRKINNYSALKATIDLFTVDTLLGVLKREKIKLPKGTLTTLPIDIASVQFEKGNDESLKGVVLEHRSIVNTTTDLLMRFDISEKDRVFHSSEMTDPFAIYEILMALFSGSTLVLPEVKELSDSKVLAQFIKDQAITLGCFTSEQLGTIASDIISKQRLHIIKDGCKSAGTLGHHSNTRSFFGSLESGVCSAFYTEAPDSSQVIGKPISNMSLLILNEHNGLQPVHVQGEICIQGVGVARGYYNNEDLTRQKFIQHPELEDEILYKTGIMGRRLASGHIEVIASNLKTKDSSQNGELNKEQLEIHQTPKGETAKKMANIWETLLDTENVGMHCNYFELGGNSQKALQILDRLKKVTGVELSLAEFYNYPSIAMLSNYILQREVEEELPEIQKVERQENPPLSFYQEQFVSSNNLNDKHGFYLAGEIALGEDVDKKLLADSIRSMVNRHEILRTIFKIKDGNLCQEILNKNNLKLTYTNFSKRTNEDVEKLKAMKVQAKFDLSADHLIRAHLFKLQDQSHLLIYVINHLAIDDQSMSIFEKELIETYTSKIEQRPIRLSKEPLQYQDYSLWQRAYFCEDQLAKKYLYWETKLAGLKPLNLGYFFKPQEVGEEPILFNYHLDNDQTRLIRQYVKEQDVDLFSFFLCLFKVMLYNYTGQNDLSMGTPISNRRQMGTENIIGPLEKTLVLRTVMNEDNSFNEVLQDISSTTLEAFARQDDPLEKITSLLYDAKGCPLIETQMIFNTKRDKKEGDLNNSTTIESLPLKSGIVFKVLNLEDHIEVSIEHQLGVYTDSSKSQMQQHFPILMNVVLENPTELIGEIKFLKKGEEAQHKSSITMPMQEPLNGEHLQEVLQKPTNGASKQTSNGLETPSQVELDKKSNQLAQLLQAKGVGIGTLVGISLNPSVELMVAVWGIAKAGGSYISLKAGITEEELNQNRDEAIKFVISNSSSPLYNKIDPGKLIRLDATFFL